MSHRNNPCQSGIESVIEDVRVCVAEYRWRGINTVCALRMVALAWNTTARRIRSLFYRDQETSLSQSERQRMALAAARLLHRMADENEERARACRAKAEAIRLREHHQESLQLGGKKWLGYGKRQERIAA